MDFQTREQDPMVSIQMPGNKTEYSQDYFRGVSMPSSDLQEPFLEKEKRGAPPAPPMDTNDITGFEKLLALEGIFIEKNFSTRNAKCCGGECTEPVAQYSYKISDITTYKMEEKYQSGPQILRGSEDIPDCENGWCTTGHRPFEIQVDHQEFNHQLPNASSSFLKLEREFKYSFLCCSRPEMIVTLIEEGKKERLGRIVNPIQCGLDFRVKIYDAAESLKYVIKADCCSTGTTCPGSCSVAQTLMTVYDAFGNTESRLTVFEGHRVPQGTSHRFLMPFPKNANGSDRALLIAAIMMVGKTFFEANDIGTKCCGLLCALLESLK